VEADPGWLSSRRPARVLAPPGRARSMLGSRRAATTGTPSVATLPPGNLGALGGLVGLPRHRPHCRGERVAAVPWPPGPVELEPAPVLLGVDHEHPTGADHQVVEVRPAAGRARSCRIAHPCRSNGPSRRAVRRSRPRRAAIPRPRPSRYDRGRTTVRPLVPSRRRVRVRSWESRAVMVPRYRWPPPTAEWSSYRRPPGPRPPGGGPRPAAARLRGGRGWQGPPGRRC
jgi:hypothetical protein